MASRVTRCGAGATARYGRARNLVAASLAPVSIPREEFFQFTMVNDSVGAC